MNKDKNWIDDWEIIWYYRVWIINFLCSLISWVWNIFLLIIFRHLCVPLFHSFLRIASDQISKIVDNFISDKVCEFLCGIFTVDFKLFADALRIITKPLEKTCSLVWIKIIWMDFYFLLYQLFNFRFIISKRIPFLIPICFIFLAIFSSIDRFIFCICDSVTNDYTLINFLEIVNMLKTNLNGLITPASVDLNFTQPVTEREILSLKICKLQ